MNINTNDFGRLLYEILFVFGCFCLWLLHLVGCSDGYIDGDLRLLNGSTPREGRVEVYYDGQWGTVCDDYWDDDAATVVCRQLNFSEFGEAVQNPKFPKGSGKIMMDDVKCTGQENFLVNCSRSEWKKHNCRHVEDAGVRCRDIVHCLSEPCLNGGTCQEKRKGYACSCPENFGGPICQWKMQRAHQSTRKQLRTESTTPTPTPTYRHEYPTTKLNIHDQTLTYSKQIHVTTKTSVANTNPLYSVLSPYMVDVVLSAALLCTILSMFCLMCWVRRKLAITRKWDRRDSFSSDNEIALTFEGHHMEHNLNEYNVQQPLQPETEEDATSEYEMPKSEEEIINESMNKYYENTTRR